jgi:hypothetical protein
MLFSPSLMLKKQLDRKLKTIETILKELNIEITSNPIQITILLSNDNEDDYENNVDLIETITCKIYF